MNRHASRVPRGATLPPLKCRHAWQGEQSGSSSLSECWRAKHQWPDWRLFQTETLVQAHLWTRVLARDCHKRKKCSCPRARKSEKSTKHSELRGAIEFSPWQSQLVLTTCEQALTLMLAVLPTAHCTVCSSPARTCLSFFFTFAVCDSCLLMVLFHFKEA
jgi:hypothetical protein